MSNNKHSLFQENVINFISFIVLVSAVVIIITSIMKEDVSAQTESTTFIEKHIANNESTSEIISVTETDLKETTKEQEEIVETTTVLEVESKDYNNVTSGKLQETEYVSNDYFEGTLFLGDSRTVALRNNAYIKPENTFAINGISHVTYLTQMFTDTSTGITGDIFEIVKVRKPKRIYVALGVNGLAYINSVTFISKYGELIDKLSSASPESIIIIEGILPVNEVNYNKNPNLNNKNIDSMNEKLLEMAINKGIYFLDLSSLLKDANNQLASQYDSGDGIHFSATGYGLVYDGICSHGIY